MRLSGQAKTEFENYYQKIEFSGEIIYHEEFEILPDAMKYGVLVDWFDSVGVYITIECQNKEHFDVDVWTKHESILEEVEEITTRHEARTKAIELANEIFNNRKK